MLPFLMAIENEADRNKVEQIFEKYYGLMFYIANGILKDHASTEDAIADSIEKLIKNLHKIGKISCDETRRLIVIITRNSAINIYNKNKKIDVGLEDYETVDDAPLVLDKIINNEVYNNMVNIINALPPLLRDAAALHILHDWSYKEIEELTESKPGTVRMRIHRARKIIQEELMKQQIGR